MQKNEQMSDNEGIFFTVSSIASIKGKINKFFV